jgi:hypothetical protein
MTRQQAQEISTFLISAWSAQRGKAPADLAADLAFLAQFFAPTATTRRLRESLAQLKEVRAPRSDLPEEIFLPWRTNRGLVTPEGRVALALLESHLTTEHVIVQTEEIAWAYAQVADLYRSWGRHRLLDALGRRERPLRLPVIGFNLFLLVNRSIGEDNAFPLPPAGELEQELSRTVGPIVAAFADALTSARGQSEPFRLRGGWIVTETNRHLSEFVTFSPNALWVIARQIAFLVARLARELVRAKGRTDQQIATALDALLQAYERARPKLASRGIAHERPSDTQRLKAQLLKAFDDASDAARS